MKKAFIMLLAAVMLISALPGCGSKVSSDGSVPEAESSAAEEADPVKSTDEVTEDTEYVTVPVPEGGWTTEEIMDVTYLCGRRLVHPLSMDDLGEGFSLKNYDRIASKERLVPASLCYKGKQLANATVVKVNGKRMIYNVVLFPDVCKVTYTEPFIINGVGMYDTMEEVEAALGEPYYKDDDSLMYNDRETGESLYSLFFEDGKLVHINVDFRFDIDLPLYNRLKDNSDN